MTLPQQLQLLSVAYISPLNHPILIQTFTREKKNDLKYHYIAHTSLDVIEERSELSTGTVDPRLGSMNLIRFSFPQVGPNNKSTECYLGLLYTLEDVAVYGYITPLKVKIVLTFDLTDAVVRDADVTMVRTS